MQRSILTLRGPVPPQVQAARWRFRWEPAPMIAEAMEAHADERAARAHPYKTIGFAARDLHTCRMLLVEATLAFEAEDTPLTRREIAEAEWRFIAARHAFYEARARALLAEPS